MSDQTRPSTWAERKYPGIHPSEVERILRAEDEDRS